MQWRCKMPSARTLLDSEPKFHVASRAAPAQAAVRSKDSEMQIHLNGHDNQSFPPRWLRR